MDKAKGALKNITLSQSILGVILIGLVTFLVFGIYTDRQDIKEVASLSKVSEERLGEIQADIKEQQEAGVAYSDPFNTDRLDLEDVTAIGRVTIPKIGVNETLILGTSPDRLKVGVGLLEGSDLPLGNVGESSIIAGHRGYLFRSDFFKDLEKLDIGDTINIELTHKTLTYEVFSKRELKVNDVQSVHIEEDKTYIALVTSPPFWVTDERLLVEAELVSE